MKHIFQKWLFYKYLQDDEDIVYIVHRHFWVVWARFFYVLFFYFFMPAAAYIFYPHIYALYAVVCIMAIGAFYLFYEFLDWYSDVLILTNHNLINVVWNSFFSSHSIRIDYEDIESVQVDTNGIAQTLLQFGNLEIETANESLHTQLHDACDAANAQAKILNMKKFKEEERDTLELSTFKKALYEFVTEYSARSQQGSAQELY